MRKYFEEQKLESTWNFAFGISHFEMIYLIYSSERINVTPFQFPFLKVFLQEIGPKPYEQNRYSRIALSFYD